MPQPPPRPLPPPPRSTSSQARASVPLPSTSTLPSKPVPPAPQPLLVERLPESKSAIMDRLRREGRWDEASKFKDGAMKEAKARGLVGEDARDWAWMAMWRAFPARVEGEEEDGLELVDVEGLERGRPHDFGRDVAWVYEHLSDRGVKVEEAPTVGAWGLLGWARKNRNRFFEMVLPKAKGERGEEGEELKGERKSIEEVRGIIGEMVEAV